MDVRQHLRSALAAALADAGVDTPADTIGIERPANPDYGDWSSNVALATAKRAGRNPRELARSGAVEATLADLTAPDHHLGAGVRGGAARFLARLPHPA